MDDPMIGVPLTSIPPNKPPYPGMDLLWVSGGIQEIPHGQAREHQAEWPMGPVELPPNFDWDGWHYERAAIPDCCITSFMLPNIWSFVWRVPYRRVRRSTQLAQRGSSGHP